MLNQKLIDMIYEIEHKRRNNRIDLILNSDNEFQLPSGTTVLPTKQFGLYWFETDAESQVFQTVTLPTPLSKGLIPIRERAKRKIIYPVIASTKSTEKKVVYNGKNQNIRERVQQHIRKTGEGTGRIGINAYPELKKFNWSVYFYILEKYDYYIHGQLFESGWRGHYGLPILCEK